MAKDKPNKGEKTAARVAEVLVTRAQQLLHEMIAGERSETMSTSDLCEILMDIAEQLDAKQTRVYDARELAKHYKTL